VKEAEYLIFGREIGVIARVIEKTAGYFPHSPSDVSCHDNALSIQFRYFAKREKAEKKNKEAWKWEIARRKAQQKGWVGSYWECRKRYWREQS